MHVKLLAQIGTHMWKGGVNPDVADDREPQLLSGDDRPIRVLRGYPVPG